MVYTLRKYLMSEPILELRTKISKEKLVYTICDFYWTMGHKTIKLGRGFDDDINYENYDPVRRIGNTSDISEISVQTYKKKQNKHVFFDSMNINFTEDGFERKIIWDVDLGFREWHLVYAFIAFFATTYLSWIICPSDSPWHRYCFIFSFPIFFIVLIWLLYYYLFKYKANKLDSHPDTQKYKTDFEEFIRKKEKELLSERY